MADMPELERALEEFDTIAKTIVGVVANLRNILNQAAVPQIPAFEPATLTLEKVRGVLAEKSRVGYTAAIRALLEKRGAAKLSEIDPKEYAALLAEAEALNDG
jgi:predicted LPLAT superfamily acyltransferase